MSSSRLSQPLPSGTVDTHCHIIPPDFDKYPLVATAEYKPNPHTIQDAATYYSQTLGVDNPAPRMVLTQVSIYGTDNSALLSGLRDLGSNGRGVVEFDPQTTTKSQLYAWWAAGVRGARINLVSVSKSITRPELKALLESHIGCLAQAPQQDKWVIDMFIPFGSVADLRAVLPQIQGAEHVRICLAHFAGLKLAKDADTSDAFAVPGFADLVELLLDPVCEVYVKLSAAYRVDKEYPSDKAQARLDPIGRTLVTKAEDRVMWASDWPHTRFEGSDSVPFVEWCYSWCGVGKEGERRRNKLFRDNAARVWGL